MNDYYRAQRYPAVAGPFAGDAAEKLVFLRKVYGYFTGSVLTAALGAGVALYAGADLSHVTAQIGHRLVVIPPLVAFVANHLIIGALLMFGAFFGASYVRQQPGVNVAALFGASFVSGIYIAPTLWIASAMATSGMTYSTSPVRDAFLLASLGFIGLSAYAHMSRKDFSFLGGFVSIGLWVVLGAALLNLFLGSSALSLAIASVGVLLFGAYILFDTARMRRDPSNDDPVGAAIQLYLNFLNLFLFLLRLLTAGRRDA